MIQAKFIPGYITGIGLFRSGARISNYYIRRETPNNAELANILVKPKILTIQNSSLLPKRAIHFYAPHCQL